MVGLIVLVRTQPDKRQEFLQAVHMFCDSNKNTACVDRTVFEENGNPNRLLLMENWRDSQSLDEYLETEPFKALLGAIDVLGSLEDIRLLKFRAHPQNMFD